MPPRMTTAKTVPNQSYGVVGRERLASAKTMPATAALAPGRPAEQHAEPAVVDAEGGRHRAVLGEGAHAAAGNVSRSTRCPPPTSSSANPNAKIRVTGSASGPSVERARRVRVVRSAAPPEVGAPHIRGQLDR